MLEGNSVMMVLRENNPHHSWLGLTEQQNLTLFRGEASVVVRGEAMDVLLRRLWGWRGW